MKQITPSFKQLYPRCLAALVILIVVALASCKKEIDFIGNHYNDLSPYRISSFRFPNSSNSWDTLTFSYDKWGNPASVTRPHPAIGSPNYTFQYDNKHRLTDFIGVLSPGSQVGEFWHKYIYGANGLISIDSLYLLVGFVNGKLTTFNQSAAYYVGYDALGRVITDSFVFANQRNTTRYSYNSSGNLESFNVYDNELSFLRTNKIWMFINRNYSLNNPFIATSYNAGHLPLHWKFDQETGGSSFLPDNGYSEAYVTYERQ